MKKIEEHFNEEALVHDNDFIIKMGMTEFYDEIEDQLNRCQGKRDILVLGCGTGLEIERIKFACQVTALDISPVMLDQLTKKQLYPGLSLETICQSLLDFDFGKERYDIILTCYTLHHFNEEQKMKIYSNIYDSLKSNGVFLHGDTVARSIEDEMIRLEEANAIYQKQNVPFASFHIDVPFTKAKEVSLLKSVGFIKIMIEKEWSKTTLFRCEK